MYLLSNAQPKLNYQELNIMFCVSVYIAVHRLAELQASVTNLSSKLLLIQELGQKARKKFEWVEQKNRMICAYVELEMI